MMFGAVDDGASYVIPPDDPTCQLCRLAGSGGRCSAVSSGTGRNGKSASRASGVTSIRPLRMAGSVPGRLHCPAGFGQTIVPNDPVVRIPPACSGPAGPVTGNVIELASLIGSRQIRGRTTRCHHRKYRSRNQRFHQFLLRCRIRRVQ